VPLTPYQEEVARLLSANRSFDSYLAGGAAIHLEPHTTRYSNDLDYPGFTPFSLLEILRRRGRYHQEDFDRLKLTEPVDLPALKSRWLLALSDADTFVRSRPPGEAGCLYYSRSLERFVAAGTAGSEDAVPHYGRPGGVLPRVLDGSV
jgi:hypothetical protein